MTPTAIPNEVELVDALQQTLTDTLPLGWTLTTRPEANGPDFAAVLTGPDGISTLMLVEAKRYLTARDVPMAVAKLRRYANDAGQPDAALVVAAPYLSEATRQQIDAAGAGYLDSTGNVSLKSSRPAMLIRLAGATRDPWPSDEALRSLKGRGAARAVRALLDFAPPYGIRDLAGKADVSLASLSRTIELLDREGLIERGPRGSIKSLDWQGVLRRWTKDYGVESSSRVSTFLEPRGLPALSAKLKDISNSYAATGAFAAQGFRPVAPTRLAALYVNNARRVAEQLGLRPADAGANVWLIEPFDAVVFDRTLSRDGVMVVAPSQLAADLLTGPGRDPAEGEELVAWMERNLNAWRR